MRKPKDWEKRWVRGKRLGGGGQGTTFLATQEDDASKEILYVLKILNKQRDLERRKRMYREVAALRTLDHPGIPRYVDSNVEQYEDIAVDLYLVTEFVEGTLLSDVEKPIGLEDAIACLLRILDILEYCHERGIGHRDIKPDNVILHNRGLADPVLVDFGLSFNKDDIALEQVTESWQQLGNRFLSLPELQVRDSAKRDLRSDLASCCGILFHLLTGIEPVALLNHKGQKPHQTVSAKQALASIQDEKLMVLNHIFDVGFEVPIDRRWQSIQALRTQLLEVAEPIPNQMTELDAEAKLERLKTRWRSSTDHSQRYEVYSLFSEVQSHIESVNKDLLSQLESNISSKGSSSMDMSTYSLRVHSGFVHKFYPERKFYPTFRAFITGNELVVIAEESESQTELLRVPLGESDYWEVFRERVREYFVDGLYGRFGG